MGACLLALLVAAGCFEDCGGSSPSGATTPVDFHGELGCAFGSSAPVFMVSLEAGECAYVPRCGELSLQKAILKTVDSSVGFAVAENSGSASNLAHGDKIKAPFSLFVSTNKAVHPHLYLRWGKKDGQNPPARDAVAICAKTGTNPPADEPVQAWAGFHYESEDAETRNSESFAMEFYVTITTPAEPTDAGVSEDAGVGPDASTPDAGVGPDASTPDAGPAPSIENAYVSPQLSPTDDSFLQRTTHFTGVTQYLIAELSGATEGTTVKVSSCSVSGAGDCSQLLNSTWSVGSSTTPFELSLPRSSAQTTYNLRLAAEPSGTESGLFDLTVELHPGKGTVDCEQAEDGGGMRWLGLKLLDEQESQVESANYHLYERKSVANGGGWSKVQDYASSTFVHRHVSAMEFDTDRTFLVIAEETGTGTTVAAREFMWAQNQASDTQGCRICTMRSLGYDCEIIPMGN